MVEPCLSFWGKYTQVRSSFNYCHFKPWQLASKCSEFHWILLATNAPGSHASQNNSGGKYYWSMFGPDMEKIKFEVIEVNFDTTAFCLFFKMCYKNLNGRPKVLQARVIRLNTNGYFKCTRYGEWRPQLEICSHSRRGVAWRLTACRSLAFRFSSFPRVSGSQLPVILYIADQKPLELAACQAMYY